MANQEFYSRIIHKHDIEANWNTAAEKSNFIPKQGEIIVYDKDGNYDYERIKIGDGTTNVANLPFLLDGVEEIISDLGAITIDIGDADATTPNGINADSIGGLTKDQLVIVNLDGTEPDENDIIIEINANLFGGQKPDYYASKEWVNELLGGLANATY